MTSKEKIEYNKVDTYKHRLQKKQRQEKCKLHWLCSLHSHDDHSPFSASNKKTCNKINNQRERERANLFGSVCLPELLESVDCLMSFLQVLATLAAEEFCFQTQCQKIFLQACKGKKQRSQ
jgi:hypothetical protein